MGFKRRYLPVLYYPGRSAPGTKLEDRQAIADVFLAHVAVAARAIRPLAAADGPFLLSFYLYDWTGT